MAIKPIELETSPAYRVNDRRGMGGGWAATRANTLFQGSETSSDRKSLTLLDKDVHRNITEYGRRILMTAGRWLYANSPPITGVVDEQSALATEGMQVQFYGRDQGWGDAATEALDEWGRICDVAGWPYDFSEWLRIQVAAQLHSGDVATVLTENDDGYPLIQIIEAHRIRTRLSENVVIGGPYDGASVVDGVIVDRLRRPIAYRIADDNGNPIADVSTRDCLLTFQPRWGSQLRGFPELAMGIFDMQDLRESRNFELLAQKAASAWALIEENESGSADTAKSVIKTAVTRDSTSLQKSASMVEKLEGGAIRYFKSGSNSKLQAFSYDRPGANVMQYQEQVLRDVFAGLGWSHYFTLDPSKVGGASMRIIVERINRTIRVKQRLAAKAARRVHGYAVAKLMKLGLLPWNDDWFKWEYQFPAEITADKKYDSDVSVQEIAAGISTLSRECSKRGMYWEDVQDQRKREQERAAEIGLLPEPTPQTQPNRTPRKPMNQDDKDQPADTEEGDE
jgi:capsid protein